MNRFASKANQTTIVRRYGLWDHTSPTASCPCLRASPAQAITPTITQKVFCTYTDTCQGMGGRKWRGEVFAGRRSSSHGYYQRNNQRK